jgi:hypothetical protein
MANLARWSKSMGGDYSLLDLATGEHIGSVGYDEGERVWVITLGDHEERNPKRKQAQQQLLKISCYEIGIQRKNKKEANFAPLTAHVFAAKLLGKNKHKDMIRGFCHFSEAWWADANMSYREDSFIDEIMLGFYGPGGDSYTTGEFGVRWTKIAGKLMTRLEVYDDAWETLAHFSDLLAEMAKLNGTDPTPAEFCKILKRLGIKDLTPRKQL